MTCSYGGLQEVPKDRGTTTVVTPSDPTSGAGVVLRALGTDGGVAVVGRVPKAHDHGLLVLDSKRPLVLIGERLVEQRGLRRLRMGRFERVGEVHAWSVSRKGRTVVHERPADPELCDGVGAHHDLEPEDAPAELARVPRYGAGSHLGRDAPEGVID